MLKSIRLQIFLLALIPLLSVLAISLFLLKGSVDVASRASGLVPVVEIAEHSEAVLHELQKERGRTAVMIAAQYAAEPARLVAEQRLLTDQAVSAFHHAAAGLGAVKDDLAEQVAQVAGGLDDIAEHRAGIDDRSLNAGTNLKFYTGKIRALLNIVNSAVKATPEKGYTSQMTPFAYLTEAKEAGGLERAIGGRLFTAVGLSGEVNH